MASLRLFFEVLDLGLARKTPGQVGRTNTFKVTFDRLFELPMLEAHTIRDRHYRGSCSPVCLA